MGSKSFISAKEGIEHIPYKKVQPTPINAHFQGELFCHRNRNLH